LGAREWSGFKNQWSNKGKKKVSIDKEYIKVSGFEKGEGIDETASPHATSREKGKREKQSKKSIVLIGVPSQGRVTGGRAAHGIAVTKGGGDLLKRKRRTGSWLKRRWPELRGVREQRN